MGDTSRGAVSGTRATFARELHRPAASHRLGVTLVGLVIPLSLVALGCRAALVPTPTPSENPDFASIEASPTPGSQEILKITGKGDKESPEFHATGLSVDVKFDYKCSPENSFTVNFYGANVSPVLPDVIVDEFGTSRSDTINEPLNNTTGPYHLEIQTQCEWSASVIGTK